MSFNFLEQLGGVATLGGGAGAGFFIFKYIVEKVFGRIDKREAHIDSSVEKLVAGLEKRIETLTERLDSVERQLTECRDMHGKSEAEVARLSRIIDAEGDIRARAANIVAVQGSALVKDAAERVEAIKKGDA